MRCVFLLSVFLLVSCQKTLLHDVSEYDANAAVLLLQEAGLSAQKIRNRRGFSVNISEKEEFLALRVLQKARIPRPEHSLEEDSFLPSQEQEAYKYRVKLANSLARDLEAIEGVLEARVEISPSPRNSLWKEEKSNTSAAVLYRYQGDPGASPDEIRSLVCASLGEVSCEQIVVLAIPVQATLIEESPFAYVGPFAVAPSSASSLLLVFGGIFMLLLAFLCLSVFALLWRRKALQGALAKDLSQNDAEKDEKR